MATLVEDLVKSAKESGRSPVAIFLEMLELRFGIGQLGFSEYLDYQLHKSDLSKAEKRAFGGWRAQSALEKMLVDVYSEFMTIDKITMYAIFAGYGFPFPKILATYGTERPMHGTLCIRHPDELIDYLQAPGRLPVYIKPSSSSFGRGNILVERWENGKFILGSKAQLDPAAMVAHLNDRRGLGWILQQPLTAHPAVAEICGTRKISGLRIHSFLTPEGPTLIRAVWRINGGNNDDDHFKFGTSGNLIAELDIESGSVRRVVTGFRETRTQVTQHPGTGHALTGFVIPYWNEIRNLVCDAHLAFPGYLCPGWDIAICEDGPSILEVNSFGDIDTSQHAGRVGFLDSRFLALLRDRKLADGLHLGNYLRWTLGHSPKQTDFPRAWPW